MHKITLRSHPMLALSLSLHAVLIAVLLALPARQVRKTEKPPRSTEVFFHRPPKPPEPQPQPKPMQIAQAKPKAPRPAPKRQDPPAPRVEVPAVPVVVAAALPESPPPTPPPPPPVAHREIRLGGFKEKETAGALPERARSARAVAQTAAFAATSTDPGAPTRETRTVVTSASFDATVGSGNGGTRSVDRGSVTRTSFDAAPDAVASAPRRRERPVDAPDTPVEVLSKPKPAYTDEARRLRVEGEVVLEVTFIATGHLRVLRVLGSLGHGLDEAAIEAAKKIQFTPARRDGRPVDHTATLRVVFQLT